MTGEGQRNRQLVRQVLFYCNAGSQVGLGHVMRTLTIAGEASASGWTPTLAGPFDHRALTVIAAQGFTGEIKVDFKGETLSELAQSAENDLPTVIHVDSYEGDIEPNLNVLASRGVFVSNMQDGKFGARQATLAIDANLSAENRPEPFLQNSARLLGASLALIRPQVKAALTQRRNTHDERVLVVLGGSDPHESTLAVAHSIAGLPISVNFTIVAPNTQHERLAETFRHTERDVEILSFVEDLPALAVQHDLIVSAAGTSVWDFAYLGIPLALVLVTENQRAGYAAAVSAGIAVGLGDAQSLKSKSVADEIARLLEDVEGRQQLRYRGQDLVDGRGSWRIVSAWEQMLDFLPSRIEPNQIACKAREATQSDAQMLLDWRNDETTRRVSRDSGEIDWQTHVTWLKNVIESTDRQLYVIEDSESEAIGTVRWDQLLANEWEVSITVSPSHRGRGMAAQVLAAGEQVLRASKSVSAIATIHEDNVPSRKLFARAGYLPHSPPDERGFAQFRKWLAPRS